MSGSTSFLKALPHAEKEELLKLTTLTELPKSRYATKLAVTAYPNTRRGRKVVFSHIEIYKMVENVAGRMREAGVRPGTVCAFALPTSTEAIIYFYALWWIAAIAAPIDPDLPEDEFEKAVKDSQAKILVSPYVDDDSDPLQAKCESVSKKLDIIEWHIHRTINDGVVLETHSRFMGSGAAWAGGAGDFKLDPDEIAVHIASSGDVTPLSHYALCEAAKSFVSTYNLAINMSTMLAPPLHEIHGILILIAAFYSGGHIVLPGYGGFEADRFWEYAKTHSITWVSASSDQILDLYEANEKSSSSGEQMLTFVRSSGGGCIAAELIEKVEESLKTPVYESYGTPEVCGFATTNREGTSRPGTVGKPVDGIEVNVFNVETKELCPAGTVGEISVCGTHVAPMYLNSVEATKNATYETENDDPESAPKVWFSTGDRGTIDEDGFIKIHGNSRELRAAEIAGMEEKKERELAAAAIAAAEAERVAAEEEAARLAEEKRLEEEREAEEARAAEEEERRLKEEEEAKEKEAEKAAAAAAATAAAAAAAALAAKTAAAEKEVAERSAALSRAGVENPDALDEETAKEILARLEAIEENQRRLEKDVEGRNAAELEEMRRRVAEAEADAERAGNGLAENGKVVDVRMEELEAAVLAAAASAESSANNTREAVKAAREVADAAYGSNQSQPVEVKASTGDQGALTKTVRVPLDDVEAAMKNHPAVEMAKAFGRKDKRFGAEVFCAIVPKKGARVSEPWLKLHAQGVLPASMVPKKFYYVRELPDGISRRELSESPLLEDLASFSGYSEVKHVKGPQWKPKTKRRVAP